MQSLCCAHGIHLFGGNRHDMGSQSVRSMFFYIIVKNHKTTDVANEQEIDGYCLVVKECLECLLTLYIYMSGEMRYATANKKENVGRKSWLVIAWMRFLQSFNENIKRSKNRAITQSGVTEFREKEWRERNRDSHRYFDRRIIGKNDKKSRDASYAIWWCPRIKKWRTEGRVVHQVKSG